LASKKIEFIATADLRGLDKLNKAIENVAKAERTLGKGGGAFGKTVAELNVGLSSKSILANPQILDRFIAKSKTAGDVLRSNVLNAIKAVNNELDRTSKRTAVFDQVRQERIKRLSNLTPGSLEHERERQKLSRTEKRQTGSLSREVSLEKGKSELTAEGGPGFLSNALGSFKMAAAGAALGAAAVSVISREVVKSINYSMNREATFGDRQVAANSFSSRLVGAYGAASYSQFAGLNSKISLLDGQSETALNVLKRIKSLEGRAYDAQTFGFLANIPGLGGDLGKNWEALKDPKDVQARLAQVANKVIDTSAALNPWGQMAMQHMEQMAVSRVQAARRFGVATAGTADQITGINEDGYIVSPGRRGSSGMGSVKKWMNSGLGGEEASMQLMGETASAIGAFQADRLREVAVTLAKQGIGSGTAGSFLQAGVSGGTQKKELHDVIYAATRLGTERGVNEGFDQQGVERYLSAASRLTMTPGGPRNAAAVSDMLSGFFENKSKDSGFSFKNQYQVDTAVSGYEQANALARGAVGGSYFQVQKAGAAFDVAEKLRGRGLDYGVAEVKALQKMDMAGLASGSFTKTEEALLFQGKTGMERAQIIETLQSGLLDVPLESLIGSHGSKKAQDVLAKTGSGRSAIRAMGDIERRRMSQMMVGSAGFSENPEVNLDTLNAMADPERKGKRTSGGILSDRGASSELGQIGRMEKALGDLRSTFSKNATEFGIIADAVAAHAKTAIDFFGDKGKFDAATVSVSNFADAVDTAVYNMLRSQNPNQLTSWQRDLLNKFEAERQDVTEKPRPDRKTQGREQYK
jgi:hypothetical protein